MSQLSLSDCYPAGPWFAGGHVGPDDYLKVLEPLEHSVLDHADPAGRHADIPDTVESLEHSVKFPAAPVLLADGPQLDSWQVAVVWVDETPAGDTSGWKCPSAAQNRRRPSDMSELHGGPGSPCVGEMLTSPEVTGNVLQVVPAGGSPLAGAVNPAGPDGPVVEVVPLA